MMRSLLSLLIFISVSVEAQNCQALFSFNIKGEKVTFENQSLLANAHYFWNFGDGTASNFKHPIHEYPDNGNYLVTLYALDTITKCSDHFDMWITVVRITDEPCFPAMADSIYFIGNKGYYKIINLSSNCEMYRYSYGTLGGQGVPWSTFSLPQIQGNALSCINIADSIPRRVVLKTLPYMYDRSKNYNHCSSNFEWKILSEDSGGQHILFTAMNKEAATYTWAFSGFGDVIFRYSDTTSMYFPMGLPKKVIPRWIPLVHLKTTMRDGCRDSVFQRLMHRSMNVTVDDASKVSSNTEMVKVYPSYIKDRFYIEVNPGLEVREISIIDATGRIVLSLPPESREADISALASGIYVVRFTGQQGSKIVKVVKD